MTHNGIEEKKTNTKQKGTKTRDKNSETKMA